LSMLSVGEMVGGGVGVLVVLLDVFFYVLLFSLYCESDVFVGVCVTTGSNIDIVAIHVGYVLLPRPRIIDYSSPSLIEYWSHRFNVKSPKKIHEYM
jgi:hypothetical protein